MGNLNVYITVQNVTELQAANYRDQLRTLIAEHPEIVVKNVSYQATL